MLDLIAEAGGAHREDLEFVAMLGQVVASDRGRAADLRAKYHSGGDRRARTHGRACREALDGDGAGSAARRTPPRPADGRARQRRGSALDADRRHEPGDAAGEAAGSATSTTRVTLL